MGHSLFSGKRRRPRKRFVIIFLGVCILAIGFIFFPQGLDPYYLNQDVPPIDDKAGVEIVVPSIRLWKPVRPDIARIKKEGCVADGLLSDYNKPEVDIPLARESDCHYFHRALETWLKPPDFEEAQRILLELDRPDAVYGMFIAEAIDRKADYLYRKENRLFDFSEMCRKHSKHFWGEHTCKPSLKTKEYQNYLRQITRDAMDVGVRVFLFGQIHHQEESTRFPKVDNVIREMRSYADARGIEILIGAQTGEITREKYLKHFDFIEGGIGLWPDGHVEGGPCFTKFWKQEGDWCWPLMWHERWRSLDIDTFVYLDWNGQKDDDMHVFASMPTPLRHHTLENLYSAMTARNIGFFFPLITPLPRNKGDNCYGPRKSFYSPAMDYDCKDMEMINTLLPDQKE